MGNEPNRFISDLAQCSVWKAVPYDSNESMDPNIAGASFDTHSGTATVHITGNVVLLEASVRGDRRIAMDGARARLRIQ